MRKKIKCKIPATHQTATTPLTIASVPGYLCAHFNEDNLDINNEDIKLSLNSDEDEYNSSDSDSDDFSTRMSRKQKKKVKFEVKEVPGASPVQLLKPTDIEELTRQMEDLRVGHARQLEDIQRGQAMLLREISASRTGNGSFRGIEPSIQDRKSTRLNSSHSS